MCRAGGWHGGHHESNPLYRADPDRRGRCPGTGQAAMDEEYARLVKEWTTRPEFMSPLVDHLPKVPGVPSPKDVLGYYVGQPKKLTKVADLGRYYRALAAASKRVKVLPVGTTDEGREQIVAVVADEETIANLDLYKGYLARLADPRGLSEPEARNIIAQAKPIYMFTGGLHSAETGPPEMLMELAYRLAVEDSPLYDQIRKNVIVMMSAPPNPIAATVMPIGITNTNSPRRKSRTVRRALPTGGSTSSTTTTATSTTRR